MHPVFRYLVVLVAAGTTACAAGDAVDDRASGASARDTSAAELVGSFELVRRELPDGKIVVPPEIAGFMTFTDGRRHFHLYERRPDGTPSSVSMIAKYSISGEEYSEALQYEVLNNQPDRPGLRYNFAGPTFTTPYTRRGTSVSFRDGGTGPMLVFQGDSLVATLDGVFVDRWVRVE